MQLIRKKGRCFDENIRVLKENNINRGEFNTFLKEKDLDIHEMSITDKLLEEFLESHPSKVLSDETKKAIVNSKKSSLFNLILWEEFLLYCIIVSGFFLLLFLLYHI